MSTSLASALRVSKVALMVLLAVAASAPAEAHHRARLSADLGMTVAVEGIETVEQLALIAAEKTVDEAQLLELLK